jgi:hypothetical protein
MLIRLKNGESFNEKINHYEATKEYIEVKKQIPFYIRTTKKRHGLSGNFNFING